MDVISFIIDSERFDLGKQDIPDGSLLHKMITTKLNVDKDENGCYILNYNKEDFIPIYEYLKNKKLPSYEDLIAFDYFGIDLNHSYELASVIEEDMRANMYKYYKDECKELYKDNHHGLIKITENFWNKFDIIKSNDKNLLFNTKNLVKSKWSVIKEKLDKLKKFTDIKGVFIAGGSIFSILFGLPINDIDLFFYGVTEDQTIDVINEISKMIRLRNITEIDYLNKVNQIKELFTNKNLIKFIVEFTGTDNDNIYSASYYWSGIQSINQKLAEENFQVKNFQNFIGKFSKLLREFYGQEKYDMIYNLLKELVVEVFECTRTNNAITFKSHLSEVQVILRLYQTPSEVLHGFDVDSCCLGFDGNDIWMTQRACFALKNGYNTVNFNRLSPSYEMRLAKYGCRGMAIKINNFDVSNVSKNELADYLTDKKEGKTTASYSRHHHLSKLYNIDKLLYLEYYCEHYNYKSHSINMINKLNHEKSDYAAPSFIDYQKCANGSGIGDLMGYFYDVYVDYLEFDKETEEDGPVDFTDDLDDLKEKEKHCSLSLNSKSKFLKSEVNNTLNLLTNSIKNKFWFIKGDLKYLNLIINIPDIIYDALQLVQPWDFPAKLKFKTTNPGEQMTNTFHQIILEDNSKWYDGKFYKST